MPAAPVVPASDGEGVGEPAQKQDAGQKRKRVAWTKIEEAALRRGYQKYHESGSKW